MNSSASRYVGFTATGLLVAFAGLLGSCDKDRGEPSTRYTAGTSTVGNRAALSPCTSTSECAQPGVCLVKAGITNGICLPTCQSGQPCPKGWRCTGLVLLGGKMKQYCRRATRSVGQDCPNPPDGCKSGHRCYQRKCIKLCKNDRACAKTARCLPVVGLHKLNLNQKLFVACLPAEAKRGDLCDLSKNSAQTECMQGLECVTYGKSAQSRCIKQCPSADATGDKVCGPASICSLKIGKGVKQTWGCLPAAKKGQPCNTASGQVCLRGLTCTGSAAQARCK